MASMQYDVFGTKPLTATGNFNGVLAIMFQKHCNTLWDIFQNNPIITMTNKKTIR